MTKLRAAIIIAILIAVSASALVLTPPLRNEPIVPLPSVYHHEPTFPQDAVPIGGVGQGKCISLIVDRSFGCPAGSFVYDSYLWYFHNSTGSWYITENSTGLHWRQVGN